MNCRTGHCLKGVDEGIEGCGQTTRILTSNDLMSCVKDNSNISKTLEKAQSDTTSYTRAQFNGRVMHFKARFNTFACKFNCVCHLLKC